MNYHIDQLLNETHQTPVRQHGIYYTLSIFQQALHEHASQDWMRSELYWAYRSATNASTELAKAVADTIDALGQDYLTMGEQALADYETYLDTWLHTPAAKQTHNEVKRLYALRAYKHESNHKE